MSDRTERIAQLEKARGAIYGEYQKARKGCLGNPTAREAAGKWKNAAELELVLTYDKLSAHAAGKKNNALDTDRYKARIKELDDGIAKASADAKAAKAAMEKAMGV
jgi:hypothetical protein